MSHRAAELERPLLRPNRADLSHVAECLLSARLAHAPGPRDPLTDPTAGTQRRPRERVLMPDTVEKVDF